LPSISRQLRVCHPTAEQQAKLGVSLQRQPEVGRIYAKDRDRNPMFFFFSNRLGCAGSLPISVVFTLFLPFLFRVI
jgi:hypothetical protein